jgi:2-polyprenyl-3-methyl-5-hydroxy-6-metoxy-1,4-benzoquinol methylase
MREAEFDKFADEYKHLLNASLGSSGESGEYFAQYKAHYLKRLLSHNFSGKILDFGCGIGLLAEILMREVPSASVHGYDPSQASIERVNPRLAAAGRFVAEVSGLDTDYDAIVMANVLHHIPPDQRSAAIHRVVGRMKRGGKLIIFEHNPINPLARRVVATCAFDEGVIMLKRREAVQLVTDAGLTVKKRDFIVFFPRPLAMFRSFEPALARCPLGAQYVIVGEKNGQG